MMGLSTSRLFVLLLLVTAIAFGLRSHEVFENFVNNKSISSKTASISQSNEPEKVSNSMIADLRNSFSTSPQNLAVIEPAAGDKDEKMMSDEKMDKKNTGDKEKEDKESSSELGDPPDMAEATEWRDFMDEDLEFSESRLKLLEDLSARRKIIDKQSKELKIREALLQAAERELDQKYEELELLKTEIEQLLGKQSEEEEKRILSLVKIYEGMKAKDAARIFNTLDTDVLLSVLGRMSERKSAPIIASMDPNRARSVTILLAEQKSLPNLSAQ